MKLAIPFGLLLVLALISSGCMTSSSPASPVTAAPTAAVFTTPIQTLAHSGGQDVTYSDPDQGEHL